MEIWNLCYANNIEDFDLLHLLCFFLSEISFQINRVSEFLSNLSSVSRCTFFDSFSSAWMKLGFWPEKVDLRDILI